MSDRLYILSEVDPADFLGTNGENLLLLRNLFPKLRILGHDRVLRIIGDPEESKTLAALLDRLVQHLVKYNTLSEEVIRRLAHGEALPETRLNPHHILFGNRGKSISARGVHQQEMVAALEQHDLLFAIGPAGTGKTFVAIALAVKAFKEKRARRIILCRPAVEAGEKLGFLPGELKDKLDPYLQPLYDALEEMIPAQKLKDYMENGTIQIAPLAYMRGRTLNDAVIILDEAQNTTHHQMKMFLTRMGHNAKMIVTGDISQIDLPHGVTSGLKIALRLLEQVPPVAIVRFGKEDIVRHPLVQLIVEAYEGYKPTENYGYKPTEHYGYTPGKNTSLPPEQPGPGAESVPN